MKHGSNEAMVESHFFPFFLSPEVVPCFSKVLSRGMFRAQLIDAGNERESELAETINNYWVLKDISVHNCRVTIMAPFLTNQSKAFVYALVSNSPSHPLKPPRAEGSVAAARKRDRF